MLITGSDLVLVAADCLTPFRSDAVKGASVDIHLGETALVFFEQEGVLDSHQRDYGGASRTIPDQDGLYIPAGGYALASSLERVRVPGNLAARVEGKSSLGRRFLFVHVTAGFIDPGFNGNITFELYNPRRVAQILHVGDPIAQLCFMQCSQVSGYEGKYSGEGVQGSLYHLNFIDKSEQS